MKFALLVSLLLLNGAALFAQGAPDITSGPDTGDLKGKYGAKPADLLIGDLDHNGVAYEPADARMFEDFFLEGSKAFSPYIEDAIYASDVNGDGIPLSVADLQCLLRVIVGLSSPEQRWDSKERNVRFTMKGGRFSCLDTLGSMAIVFADNATPRLLVPNMELRTRFDGYYTRCIIFPNFEAGPPLATMTGDIIECSAPIVSFDLATVDGKPGYPVKVATDLVLYQNQPNPFTSYTRISIELPRSVYVRLDIYNILGQQVVSYYGGTMGPGFVNLYLNGDYVKGHRLSPGVYFYRLTAGDYTETRKMVKLR
ncbi:MAG TPA: T9SS type A sorting domain-containing protein [Candidatus Acidoferrum sp.]|nr:T9SS type A sorting domain-containing protein [Candidatus Acidoferrum sp.]